MPSTAFYRAAELRRVEAAASGQPLMQRAGRAAADLAVSLCAERGAAILILAGPGNNGGDAFVAAMLLRQRFFDTRVVFVGAPEKLPADAANAYRRFLDAGGTCLTAIPDEPRWALLIDGLFGIGLTRTISGLYAGLIEHANALARRDGCPLLALDCPSGLDADTGTRLGATILASHTITFIGNKPGLLTADGPDCCGVISIATLDLAPGMLRPESGRTVGRDLFAAHLRPRQRNSHKGTNGNAGVLGGAATMVGGALLAARAALRLGSGRVYLGLLDEHAPAFDVQQPELMLRSPQKLLASEATTLTALACGPGMGTSHEARVLLEKACQLELPLLLDADALNLLASEGEVQVALATRSAPTLLTPHPAEAARLLDSSVAAIEADRLAAAHELAAHYNAWVVLKGCGTIIAAPDGRCFINTSGNPGLATAGSGDVLSGIITALLAQGWPPRDALLAGVHVHGAAADRLVARGSGPIGLTAGELIDSARWCLNQWINTPVPAKRLGVILFLIATLLFALHDTTSKYLIAFFAIPLLVWARYIVHLAIMLLVVAPRLGRALIVTRRPWLMTLRALTLVGVSLLFQNALKALPLAETTAIVFVTPLLVALLAGPLLGEKVRLGTWLATVAGFCGVLLIARPGGAMSASGVAYALGSALCYAAYQILTRKLAATEPAMRQLFYTALVGTISLSLMIPSYWNGQLPTPGQALLIVSLGVTAGVGHFLLIRAFRETPASTLSPLLYIQLVWAMLLGLLVFDQLPDLLTTIGMTIIGASCLSQALSQPRAPT